MTIRNATFEDFPAITKIFEHAREYMRKSGNPNQWGSNRPDPALIEKDITLQRFYVVADDDGNTLLGAFAFIIGEDPTYQIIYDGKWLNNKPYGTLHRLAGAGIKKGIFDEIIRWASEKGLDLRADTHAQNLTMQHLLEKNGFQKCGIILLGNGDPRIAYHKPFNANKVPTT